MSAQPMMPLAGAAIQKYHIPKSVGVKSKLSKAAWKGIQQPVMLAVSPWSAY
jgi:hypothetical protein